MAVVNIGATEGEKNQEKKYTEGVVSVNAYFLYHLLVLKLLPKNKK